MTLFVLNSTYQQVHFKYGLALCRFVPMRILLLFMSFMLLGFGALAQELKLKGTVKGEFNYMTTDHIGRLYLSKGQELFLYSPEGQLLYQFSDLSRGEIVHLDTRNPMKLLLFYPDYSQISFLDNTLSKTREYVDLNSLDLELAQLACASFDNGFWVYDPVSFRLVRFDQGLNVTNEVANINQLVGAEVNPIQIEEFDSWLYMNDPQNGIFVFDSFGTYSKLIPIPGASQMQVRANGLFLLIGNKIVKYDDLNLEPIEIDLPVEDFRSVRIEKNMLFILTKDGVQLYSLRK